MHLTGRSIVAQVIIKFASKEIPKSPFKVSVEGAAGDASKVTAKGPGIEKTGVVATKKTYFEVFTKGTRSASFFFLFSIGSPLSLYPITCVMQTSHNE